MAGWQTAQAVFDGLPPRLVTGLCILLFCAVWILVCRIIAAMGWSTLAVRYAAKGDVPADAWRFWFQSMAVRGAPLADYRNCINGWTDLTGLYLRPGFPFSLFHPLLLVRWEDMVHVEEKAGFHAQVVEVELSGTALGLRLFGSLGQDVLAQWQITQPQSAS